MEIDFEKMDGLAPAIVQEESTGDVLMVEGEMLEQQGSPVFDSFRYPRYGIRSVWRVPETE